MTDSLSLATVIALGRKPAPAQMMPCRPTSVPIMNQGTSARNTSGMLDAPHNQMKQAAFSAESTKSTPPRWLG